MYSKLFYDYDVLNMGILEIIINNNVLKDNK